MTRKAARRTVSDSSTLRRAVGTHTYLVLDSHFAHPAVDVVRAASLWEALDVYAASQFLGARKFKNGRWRWGDEYFDSVGHLIASRTSISFEMCQLKPSSGGPVTEGLCGIDWFELMYNWRAFYMNPKRKVGKMYEWFSEESQYYAVFPSPRDIRRKFAKFFSDR
jgi:hypothetical protein